MTLSQLLHSPWVPEILAAGVGLGIVAVVAVVCGVVGAVAAAIDWYGGEG